MRRLQVLLLLVVGLAAGCAGSPSTVDYAEDVEALVTTMNARLDQLDTSLDDTKDLAQIRTYSEQRIGARSDFVAGMQNLEPSDEVAELHKAALDIMERVTLAESKMADRVMRWDSPDDIEPIWETPEGVAARAADAQAVALCLVAQAEFDQTADRAGLEDVPWVPSEMKSVIIVAFGCEAASR